MGPDLADVQLFKFLLGVINIFSKCKLVVPSKDKKVIIITGAFQKIFEKSSRKPNKIWVNEGGESGNRSMKSFLQDNDMEMYLTHNEETSVVAERVVII